MSEIVKHHNGADLLEKVIINNDLAGLTSLEKVTHIKNICESLGLNPLTKPFQLLKFQGKEVIYCTKDATEQLRKNYEVSIKNIDTKIIDGIYIVTANACFPDGRSDSSTGVISIKGLIGDALANAMMKAETKAKRRVTLSICGLGLLDEAETDTMKGAVKLDHNPQTGEVLEPSKPAEKANQDMLSFNETINLMLDATTEPDLKQIFTASYKKYHKNLELIDRLVKAKDEARDRIVCEQDLVRLPLESTQNIEENVNIPVVNGE